MTQFLKPEEITGLILNACDCPGGVDEAEMERIVQWANSVRIDETLLTLTLTGKLRVTFPEGVTEPIFLEKQ